MRHAAADDCASQVRMSGKIVADDDQLEVLEYSLFCQFCFQRRKALDDSHHVFVRADAARVEQKGVVNLVAFRDELVIGRTGVPAVKPVVNRVVNHFYVFAGNSEKLLDVLLGEVRYSKNASGPPQHPAGQIEMRRAADAGALPSREVLEHVVYGHDIGTGQRARKPEKMRDMDQVAT